jgi:hypothetical protein
MTNLVILHRSCCFLLTAVLLTEVGCVTRQAYEKARAEADELTRTLDIARTDVTALDRRIAELQTANRREDAVTTDLRAAIKREQDQLAVLRQRADARLASLQAQVAHLVNQSRAMTRQIAAAKQERASLQAMTAQYKQELEESRLMPTPVALSSSESIPAQPVLPPSTPSATADNPAVPPQQTAQVNPVVPPKPAIPPPPATVEPPPADDSWTGLITSWFSMLWSWVFD